MAVDPISMLRLLARQAEDPDLDPSAGVAANIRTVIGVSVFSIVLAVVSTGLRFVFRKNRKLPWLLDDYMMVIATTFVIADAACYMLALRYGFGHHIYTLTPADMVSFFKVVFATFILYGFAVTAVKIGVLYFYRRIFPGADLKIWLMVLGTLSLVWFILITLISVFQCNPVQKAWEAEIPGYCIPYLDIFIGIQVANIVLDAAILCLPITTVVKLHMTVSTKISVAGTFGLGGLSIVFAIVRLAILILDRKQTDITFAVATANWSIVEPAFEIFCACLPTMTPLLKYIRQVVASLGFSRGRSYGGSYKYKEPQAMFTGQRIHITEEYEVTRPVVSTDEIPLRGKNSAGLKPWPGDVV
ncbi:hypothetical protein VTN77DRAFT_8046 [Rasamsonia byssochlamydoides]|uniref:uncharacterized protein n=1 Tax=Rasamsonia byssochlamydoides TaxID=89139 RepID=UPI0037425817